MDLSDRSRSDLEQPTPAAPARPPSSATAGSVRVRPVTKLPASSLTAELDHPDFDRGEAALEHLEFLRNGLADVEHAPAHVRAAVGHLGVDGAAVLEVADFDEGPERERAMRHRGLLHAEGALVGHQLAFMELAIPAGLPALAYRGLGGGDRGHGNGAQQARKWLAGRRRVV